MDESKGISVATVKAADDLAVAVLALLDVKATGERSVVELVAVAIERAWEYRASRVGDVAEIVAT